MSFVGASAAQRRPARVQKDDRLAKLQAENERLRAELALRSENERLRAELTSTRRLGGLSVLAVLLLILLLVAVLVSRDRPSGVAPEVSRLQDQIAVEIEDPAELLNDPAYWTSQCPPGTGFYQPGVKKCVVGPPAVEPLNKGEDALQETVSSPGEKPGEARRSKTSEELAPVIADAAPALAPLGDTGALVASIAPAREISASDPWGAIELYRAALAGVGIGLPEADEIGVVATAPKRAATLKKHGVASALASMLDEAADLYTATQQYSAALATLQLSHKVRRRVKPRSLPAAEMTLSAAGLSAAYGRTFRYDEAIGTLRSIAPLTKSLPAQAVGVLTKQEASMHECAGDFVSALQRTEEAAKYLGQPASGAASDVEGRLRHLELLRRVRETAADTMPPEVAKAMENAAQDEQRSLLSDGPWLESMQMPKHYRPGLLAQPFHELPAAGSEDAAWTAEQSRVLNAAVAYLEQSDTVKRLVEELHTLRSGGKMYVEQECIHEVGGGRGQWRRYDPTEAGQRHLEDDGSGGKCAFATAPHACGVLVALRASGLRAIRGSYSEIGAQGVLRPHYGMTNGQLKFHLGLEVPTVDGSGCSTLRVGKETRHGAWEEGRVLFFDDSFEHEVLNGCDRRRAVFQVVFLHPGLWQEAGDDWRGAAGFTTA